MTAHDELIRTVSRQALPWSARPFAGALMLASALAAAGTVAMSDAAAVRAASLALAAAVCGAGVVAIQGRSRWLPIVAVGALGAGALWAIELSDRLAAVPVRPLQVAVLLGYAAIAVAVGLVILRVTSAAKALLLAGSTALALFVADAMIRPPTTPFQTPWKHSMIPDPVVGSRYAPHSTAANFYPDNPRRYFEQTDPIRASWSLETHEGSEAKLEHLDDKLRVTVAGVGGPTLWYVKLQQAPFDIHGNTEYVLSFDAQADLPRTIGFTLGQTREPWDRHAPYWEASIEPEWVTVERRFTASAGDVATRLFFDLGGSTGAVTIANVTLRDSTGRIVKPAVAPQEYFVSYRFNALGFRGPDYAIPPPPGTVRIVTLGDSYTLGVGVHERDTFSAQLEQRLNASLPAHGSVTRYEVINTGVSGYSTRQERLSYELYSSAYQPQLVLLVMVFNDDLTYEEEVNLGYAARADRAKLSNLWSAIQAARGPDRPYDYTNTVREVLELNAACAKRGAKLGVVVFRNTRGFKPWSDLVAAVNEGLRGTNIPVLDLFETLLGDGRDERDLWVHAIDGHPNDEAHRLAAGALEGFLRAQGWLP
jgi:lysophospholipase L1-like esterase